MEMAEWKDNVLEQIDQWNKKINSAIVFVENKIKNFPNLSPGEQISYSAVALGLLLVLIATVLFII